MRIKALLVMPGKEVQLVKISANIQDIKELIGNKLFRIKLDENTLLIGNKNASIDEFNRFYKGKIILGTFLIVSIKNSIRISMRKRNVTKYSNMFKLRKHQKKINIYKEEFLEEFYSNQRKLKQKKAKQNKQNLLKKVA